MSQSQTALAQASGAPLTILSEDEAMFRSSVREFAEGELRPRVEHMDEATDFYASRLGFTVAYADAGFARVCRDDAEIHLWESSDRSWRDRDGFAGDPVRSGAETFIAGTASCRLEVDSGIDGLYAELSASDVLHPTDRGEPVVTEWRTREFAALDLAGNLLTFFERV